MISANEDALICDLAEVYGIFEYRALPVPLLATLSVGLGEKSRIKKYMSEEKTDKKTMLLAAIVDRLSLLVWLQTEDGKNGTNRPESVLNAILGIVPEESQVEGYETGEEFEQAWERTTGVAHGR